MSPPDLEHVMSKTTTASTVDLSDDPKGQTYQGRREAARSRGSASDISDDDRLVIERARMLVKASKATDAHGIVRLPWSEWGFRAGTNGAAFRRMVLGEQNIPLTPSGVRAARTIEAMVAEAQRVVKARKEMLAEAEAIDLTDVDA